ncbi:hypothetical protein Taro_046660 [Colocasia esculenta]|uniref:GHMP kinase N-terminal domain-containing protein n=1 Tax=Colocasia esculenta TaxID=4460 RepID=A0A843X6E5_COLES|nr:hypothetical protein [Colocasia esculenta]
MASAQFLFSPSVYPSLTSKASGQLPGKKAALPSFFRHGSCSRDRKNQFCRYSSRKVVALDAAYGRRQVEIAYDPEDKVNRWADEADKNSGLSRLTLFSPCKVNVFLRITGKREDGFHDLASLFHVISLGDTIKFSLSPTRRKDHLSSNVPGVPVDDRNLIIKALNLYRRKTGSDNFFWIHLDKRVPTGAGLGGGSSNAATALWAANQFNGCLATEKELQEWSGEIGSDIPFFFSHGAAYCTGRGENSHLTPEQLFILIGCCLELILFQIVEEIPSPISLDLPMVLIKPQEACPTGEVYKAIKSEELVLVPVMQCLRLEQTSTVDPGSLLERILHHGISQDVCINDLEPPAFEVLPSLKRLKQRVLAASRGEYSAVFMSGSGSTIVGIGSPDPPQFIYDDDDYKDVFISEAHFLTRGENEWYSERSSTITSSYSKNDLSKEIQ